MLIGIFSFQTIQAQLYSLFVDIAHKVEITHEQAALDLRDAFDNYLMDHNEIRDVKPLELKTVNVWHQTITQSFKYSYKTMES